MGKEAHISNIIKDLNHLLKQQEIRLNELKGENKALKQKIEKLYMLINEHE